MSRGSKLAGPGAAIVILCFFMPWVLVSCNGQPVASLSGWKLAAGGNIQTTMGSETIPGTPVLFLVILAGIAVLLSIFMTMRNNISVQSSAWITIASAAISFIVIYSQFGNANRQADISGWEISFEIGFWGVNLGLLAAMIGGIIDVPGISRVAQPIMSKATGSASQIPEPPFKSKQPQPPPLSDQGEDSIWPNSGDSSQSSTQPAPPPQTPTPGQSKQASAPPSWKKVSDDDLE